MIYSAGGATYAITLEPQPDGRFRARIGDRTLTVAARKIDGGWLLSLDGRQVPVYTAAQGGERWAHAGGTTYTLSVAQSGRRRAASAGGGDLTAQMPGQVREVFVAAGDVVAAGQPLLLLEAMKMEIRVTAATDGRVRRVLVAAGAVVDRGQRLVEMEQD
jgi:3-methylcrotonyl-CoA carboxylase alpha subunit